MDKKEKLKIDDQTQMIQGIRISDPDLYKKIRFIVQNNHLEGWQLTEQEINDLVHDEKEFEITAQRELFLLNQGIKIKDISAFAKINAFLFSPLYD